MKMGFNKILTSIIIAVFILTPISAFAEINNKTIDVVFNKINIKIDGVSFNGNKMVYNNTVYLPIKSIASIFNLPVYNYEPTNTTYIGQVPAGEVPLDIIESWENIIHPYKLTEEILISKGLVNIDGAFNSVNVKVHGEKMNIDNILYNKEVFISLQEVCKILAINYNYYGQTSTVYIGIVPQNEVPNDVYKKWFPDKKNTLSSEPASGQMVGWQKLKGHMDESIVTIYYKLTDGVLSVKVEDIRKVDLNKIVEWTDDYGIKRYNTVGYLYKWFDTFTFYTSEWFYYKFGSLYDDWVTANLMDATYLVTDYLQQTGQIEKPTYRTLIPDVTDSLIQIEKERKEKEAADAELLKKRIEDLLKSNSTTGED